MYARHSWIKWQDDGVLLLGQVGPTGCIPSWCATPYSRF